MTDSIDKKSKEKRDNLAVDLDAMLDEAESSLLPVDELQDDEDAIDRLLMDAGFDADEAAMPTAAKTHARDARDAELDALLGFDSFGEDFHEPEKTQTAVPSNEPQDDEDTLDRLLMNAGFDADNAPAQANVEDVGADEEPDDFSDFSDFNEPETVPAAEVDEPEQAAENPSAVVADELDEFLSLAGDFDESDLIQDDEIEAPVPALADLTAPAVEEPDVEEDIGALDELDDFSGFSDFNEPEIAPAAAEVDEPEAALLSDVDRLAPDEADLTIPAVEESGQEEDSGALDELDDFSDFSDFNEPETAPAAEVDEPEQATEASLVSDVEELAPAVAELAETGDGSDEEEDEVTGLVDETDDFSFLSDDFDESDLLQDDAVAAPAAEVVDESDKEETGLADESDDFPGFSDDFDVSDLLQDDAVAAPAAEVVDESDKEETGPADESDDFPGFSDDFDASDLLQDDAVAAPAAEVVDESDKEETGLADESDDFPGFSDDFDVSDLVQDDAVAAPVEESADELQDDENNIDDLLMDAGFDADDASAQTGAKKDAFGDDADLSGIDNFFQMDEVSDDSSWQGVEAQLGETEKASDKEDDFLLPDFDITADMEISGAGVNAENKDDDLADVFGDLSQDQAMQDSGAAGDTESQSKQSADPAAEKVANVKLSPFGFEQEDIKKQLEDAENKVKKARLFSYVAVGFGVVALSAAAGLGVMIYGAKTEVAKLNAQVSTLEASLAKSVASNPKEEINAIRNSVVQLNQQVGGFITELKGSPQSPVDLLNSKVPDIVAKQDMVSKALDMLQAKVGESEGKAASEPVVAEPPKVEAAHEPVPPVTAPAPAKEGKPQETASVKAGAEPASAKEAQGPAKDSAAAHKAASAKEKIAHEPVPAPAKAETAPETAAAKVKTQPEAIKAKPVTAEKTVVKPEEKPAPKQEPVKERKQETPGKWGVNLVAFKQEWFAKSKAAEFARQGIFAEVIPVNEKNITMYRLRVGGFKSKQEAQANTNRIKKALNLDSVWVSDN